MTQVYGSFFVFNWKTIIWQSINIAIILAVVMVIWFLIQKNRRNRN